LHYYIRNKYLFTPKYGVVHAPLNDRLFKPNYRPIALLDDSGANGFALTMDSTAL